MGANSPGWGNKYPQKSLPKKTWITGALHEATLLGTAPNSPGPCCPRLSSAGRRAGRGPKGFTKPIWDASRIRWEIPVPEMRGAPANPFASLVLGEDPRAIAEPGRGADPNSVPDLAGDGTRGARGRRYLRT
jgi:hypothetical protein